MMLVKLNVISPLLRLGSIAEYTDFVVPRLSSALGIGGSAGVESVQADAL